MNAEDYEKIESMISRHIGVFAESINHKFDILVEGQKMLSEKLDRFEERQNKHIDRLEHKFAQFAADFAEHRRDTEAHPRLYQVREDD